MTDLILLLRFVFRLDENNDVDLFGIPCICRQIMLMLTLFTAFYIGIYLIVLGTVFD